VYQKILWIIAAALLAGLGFWLGWVMPSQGWAQWDGTRWQVVAESWAVLWRGWPLVAFGALVGFSAAWIGLAFALKHAKEADFRAKIARLTRQRDAAVAVAVAEAQVLAREEAARQRGVWGSTEQKTGVRLPTDRFRRKTQDFCDNSKVNVPTPLAVS
jgi:hypothetical protein